MKSAFSVALTRESGTGDTVVHGATTNVVTGVTMCSCAYDKRADGSTIRYPNPNCTQHGGR